MQQKDLLKREVEEDREFLRERLPSGSQEELRGSEKEEEGGADVLWAARAVEGTQPAEGRLQCKKRQLQDLLQQHLPRLSEEKQRVREILDRGPLDLDSTLYLVEKEMEEKEEQLAQYQASASQLQKLQATFEFTANVARQEEKVRRKEKEILESREQQQRVARRADRQTARALLLCRVDIGICVADLDRHRDQFRRSHGLGDDHRAQHRVYAGYSKIHADG